MDLILTALIFVGGLFFFKGRVKYPIWQAFKTAFMVLVAEFVIMRIPFFHKNEESFFVGLVLFYSLAIVITGLTFYRFKDKKIPKNDVTTHQGGEQ
ncbi:hypothetical protein ACTID9_01060 [Brevibacillus fluminis]|uniref:hypothetical protein n=1 Tax=Brevibacillus fluminis TaxID=511487 RepID=UPI003F8ADC23